MGGLLVGQITAMVAFDRRQPMSEIIFEVREDEMDGGYTASALGYGIHTQGDSLEELRAMVKDAVDCYFDEDMEAPKVIRLHFVRDEVLAR
jgi:predicted RNase H-like HicB family nuclease